MARAFNFCAGPAALPEDVLIKAASEMTDWQGLGLSVMEMSHRSPEFTAIAKKADSDFRELLSVPDNYQVLFMQGGATAQFSMIPMNLLRGKNTADYIVTGQWSQKAIKEGARYCDARIAGTTENERFSYAVSQDELTLNPEAAYVHYAANETIGGVEFDYIPETNSVPLVSDMSSTILSRPLDVSKFGLIYAGAQKNIGPAGLCIVIVRDDLLGHVLDATPTAFNYQVFAENDSMYNTPPTYSWYLSGLVFEWLKNQGGLGEIAKSNQRKAEKLYGFIDESGFYSNPVRKDSRSWMNIPFVLRDDSLDSVFLKEAEHNHLLNLKGHRSVGGMRASIYNAVPEAAVDALIDFMSDFADRNTR